jgi:acyl-CoA thioesterase
MKRNVLEALKEQIRDEPFANHMGIRLRDIGPGYAVMEARFSEKMTNFNGLIHGGAIFALIDEAFSAASNSHGTIALALNINITYLQSPRINSLLIVEAKEESRSKRTASYRIEVLQKDENGDQKIALCQALVYRKDKPLSFLEKEE